MNKEDKKALIVATIVGFITSFEMNNIKLLQNMGYQVFCASNMEDKTHADRIESLKQNGVSFFNVPFSRSPLEKKNIQAYKELKEIMRTERFDLVHCHTPVGGVLGRMAAHKAHVPRIIYTAHGFHFFDGAPIKNWVLYYPVEKFLSRWTDVLITINKEDYKRAQEKFHAERTEYVPGVGVNLNKFQKVKIDRKQKREELEIPENAILLLSVGELNSNKNHEMVIRAITHLDVYYVIAGKGKLQEHLQQVIDENDLKNRVKLLGYRNDVVELYKAADIYVLPSIREGLNVSIMEAMASGLPVVCSRIRGNVDLIDDARVLFDPKNICGIEETIIEAIQNSNNLGEENLRKIKEFEFSVVEQQMKYIYHKIIKCI